MRLFRIPATMSTRGGRCAIALGTLALVVLWCFTPPPRPLAAGEHASIHFHGERAMTQIEIDSKGAHGATVDVEVLDHEQHPLAIKELTLVLSHPTAGIEPLRKRAGDAEKRNARHEGSGDKTERHDDFLV